MPAIRLVKKYPHIKDEDVISIFQEGYIKGFENGRKGTIPIEYIKAFKKEVRDVANGEAVIDWLLEDWGKEND